MHFDKEIHYINETLNGDAESFRPLVEKYYEKVRAVVRRYVSTEAQAEDICQEVFIKAFRRLETFKTNKKFSTWLFKIATNTSLEYLRKNKLDICTYNDFAANDNSANPAEYLNKYELVDECLKNLKFNHQILFLLRHGLELSYEEIADFTDSSLASVKSELFRLRAHLKKVLGSKRHKETELQVGEKNAGK